MGLKNEGKDLCSVKWDPIFIVVVGFLGNPRHFEGRGRHPLIAWGPEDSAVHGLDWHGTKNKDKEAG